MGVRALVTPGLSMELQREVNKMSFMVLQEVTLVSFMAGIYSVVIVHGVYNSFVFLKFLSTRFGSWHSGCNSND